MKERLGLGESVHSGVAHASYAAYGGKRSVLIFDFIINTQIIVVVVISLAHPVTRQRIHGSDITTTHTVARGLRTQ